MKFRKKPLVIEATQWFKNGDHPQDACEMFDAGDGAFQGEGHIVRYFRRPDVSGTSKCEACGKIMDIHGWIDDARNGGAAHIVCPGDWIITGVHGEMYPCKPSIFDATHEPIEDTEVAAMAKN